MYYPERKIKMKSSPGMVVVTKFVTSEDKLFSSYIDYINREAAIRNKHIDQYNQFMDYMGNPNKTGELFTAESDSLSVEEKNNLKKLFEQAQENGSIMWQTVFSFRNDWLEKQGILKDGILDENKMQEIVRGSMNKMLEKENIQESAVWSAAIHYNTDNIHVHIATTEPISVRAKKRLELVEINEDWLKSKPDLEANFEVIRKNREQGFQDRKYEREFLKKLKEALVVDTGEKNRLGNWIDVNEAGKLIVSSVGNKEERSDDNEYMKVIKSSVEYKGNWKQSTINSGKSFAINKLLDQAEENNLINSIMRDSIIEGKKNIQLRNDTMLQHEFMNIFYQLPADRRQWAYASNILGFDRREQLDQLSKKFIEKYFPDEMKELKGLLEKQAATYEDAYGSGNFDREKYIGNKMQDLYKRIGNSILREMKNLDRENRKKNSDGSSTSSGRRSSSRSKRSYPTSSGKEISQAELGKSMIALKRYLEKDIDNYKNQIKYERLEDEIIEENKIQNTIADERKGDIDI